MIPPGSNQKRALDLSSFTKRSTEISHFLPFFTKFFPLHLQVTMKYKEDAEKACLNPNPVIDGRKANVNLAYLGAKNKQHTPSKQL